MNLDAWSRSMVQSPQCPCPGTFGGPPPLAFMRASAGEIFGLRRTRDRRVLVEVVVCMPMLLPVWIAEYIWAILFSRIRLRMAAGAQHDLVRRHAALAVLGLAQRLRDHADQRFGQHRAHHLLLGGRERRRRSGPWSWRRSRCAACRTPGGRFLGAVSARRMVSRSRISPTRMASGSSRSAERSALAKLSVCGPTSRWLIRHFFDSCTNSIGSSTVRMWPYSFR